MPSLAAIALALPGVDEGIACAGTALESRTHVANRKAFLYVSADCVRLELDRSVAEARKRGGQVGAGGWTKLAMDGLPPATDLKRWIAESHGLIGAGSPGKRSSGSESAGPKRS